MTLTQIEQFAIIFSVGVFVAFVIGYQWACEDNKKEGGKNNEQS